MNKYKVDDKIVLTVSDVNEKAYYSYYVFNNNDLILWESSTDKYAEPLSTYTEPLEAKIRRQAAEITRLLAENKELKEDFEKSKRVNLNMGRLAGQKEAWELARKIASTAGGLSSSELIKIFNSFLPRDILSDNTYPEAAAKVAGWEKAKEEIKVGDIYRSETGNYVAIRTTDGEKGVAKILFMSNGEVTPDYIKSHCTKTGRHIDIDSLLKQIGGGDDEK